jgi:7,8-dihydropterin-6-yl-methyl-4-(beta-D-ribofuranosyl)aminobenzene 5'-phosphate synthase
VESQSGRKAQGWDEMRAARANSDSGLQVLSFAAYIMLSAGCAAAADKTLPPDVPAAIPSLTLTPFLPQTDSPGAMPSPTETTTSTIPFTPAEMLMTPADAIPLTITILYNNIPHDPRLQADWGFSALVERGQEVLLFDTGGNGLILLGNMRILGVDASAVRHVVISHAHSDHTGGLALFLKNATRPPVYLLTEFGSAMIHSIKDQTEAVEVMPGMEISPGIFSTGNVGGSIAEQSLLIRTQKGLIIITGCAHPGIVRIIQRAVELTGDEVYLVLGGVLLGDKSESQISAILRDFRRLGVRKAAPSHCTGELAIAIFAAEYGDDFLRTGAGSILRLEG